MAPHQHANKTTISYATVLQEIEEIIPPVKLCCNDKENALLLLDDRCDSHRFINILEIPNYLSFTTNKTFENMVREKLDQSNSSLNIQTLGSLAILMHQLHMIDLEKSLWTIYFKSGTANLFEPTESTLKIWPTCVTSMLQLWKRATTLSDLNQIDVHDRLCFDFVTEHLRELDEQQKQIQERLSQTKKQFHGYTNRTEAILQTFIQQHIELLHLQYKYKVQFVELNYHQSVLENKFLQENPNEQQKQFIERLLHRKYDYETAKHEVLLMKHHMTHNQPPKSLRSISMALSYSIHSLTDQQLREHLQERHLHVMKHYKDEMMKLFLEIVETKLQESCQLFDTEIAKLWQDQRSLPTPQRFNHTIMHLIESQLTLISRKVACIYNYKTLQQ